MPEERVSETEGGSKEITQFEEQKQLEKQEKKLVKILTQGYIFA